MIKMDLESTLGMYGIVTDAEDHLPCRLWSCFEESNAFETVVPFYGSAFKLSSGIGKIELVFKLIGGEKWQFLPTLKCWVSLPRTL